MITLPVGFVAMFAIFAYALGGAGLTTIVNHHAVLIVVFGTAGVLLLTTPLSGLKGLLKNLLNLIRPDISSAKVNGSLVELSRRRDAVVGNTHALIAYAQELWDQGVEAEIWGALMVQRLEELNGAAEQAVTVMRNLAKYPPALGMTGTVVGLVSLFSNLTPETRDRIGPSLALALCATFYGLVLANAVLMPLADRLHVTYLAKVKLNDHVYQSLLLIHQGEPANIVGEDADASAA